MTTWDVCLPSRGLRARDAVALAARAEELGYGGVWVSEVAGHDSMAILSAMALSTSRVRLGTAIVPLTTRSPALLSMGASTLAQLAPGRAAIGMGVSSRAIIEEWHGRGFPSPVSAAADTCDIMRQALDGGTTDHVGRALSSHGFRLHTVPEVPPVLFLAALGPAMRQLAAERFDGVILNFLPRSRLDQVIARTPPTEAFEVTTLVRVSVDSSGKGEERLRKELASYLRVDQYRRWLHSLGLPLPDVADGAPIAVTSRQIPSDVLSDIAILGDSGACRRQLEEMCQAGVTPIVIPDAEVGDLGSLLRTVEAVAPLREVSTQSELKGRR